MQQGLPGIYPAREHISVTVRRTWSVKVFSFAGPGLAHTGPAGMGKATALTALHP
ncbi:hypothetical protein [Trueperella pyogenes]